MEADDLDFRKFWFFKICRNQQGDKVEHIEIETGCNKQGKIIRHHKKKDAVDKDTEKKDEKIKKP